MTPFRDVLEYLESHGWVLQRIDESYRVFIRHDSLPILVRVTDKRVDDRDFERIQEIVRREEQGDAGD